MDALAIETLARFDAAWTEVEIHYDNLIHTQSGYERLKGVRAFMDRLKSQDYHKHFRLGTSIMGALIFSRAVEHRLRADQKYVWIEIYDFNFYVILCDADRDYEKLFVENLEDERVFGLLKVLKSVPID